jgi:hypothetical protein
MLSLKTDNQLINSAIANTMGIFGHRKSSLAFKGALTLLYLILLGSQLSHKFYLCANTPIRTITTEHGECTFDEPSSGRTTIFLNFKKFSALSIDKRYEFEHTFVVPGPEINLRIEYSEITTQVCLESWCCISSNYVAQPFRGPPAI